mmetsp:Transcript_36034/g.41006  ORF Transcript_36034/g.41006 Transcript_36034/m.41006 type:complete len:80 (+) Transcript_36034:352-591(+)
MFFRTREPTSEGDALRFSTERNKITQFHSSHLSRGANIRESRKCQNNLRKASKEKYFNFYFLVNSPNLKDSRSGKDSRK